LREFEIKRNNQQPFNQAEEIFYRASQLIDANLLNKYRTQWTNLETLTRQQMQIPEEQTNNHPGLLQDSNSRL